MSDVAVRLATAADAKAIAGLIHEHAAYEGAPEDCHTSADDIRRDGFGDAKLFDILIAERDGAALGFAMFLEVFSSWEGRSILYLEDLYVSEAARGAGVGRKLMTALAGIVVARGCPRLDWLVTDDNPARDFYHRLGGEHMESWRFYRLRGDALRALASDDEGS